jgi:hypothetical protein
MTSQDNVRRRQYLLPLLSPGFRLALAAARVKPTPAGYFSEGAIRLCVGKKEFGCEQSTGPHSRHHHDLFKVFDPSDRIGLKN